MKAIAVIIPVYNGTIHLRRLFSTLLENTPEENCRFVVVDDASTDPEVSEILSALAGRDARVQIVKNETNLGFVKSANRGLRLAEGGHCVLLNSDTQVPKGWLSRLVRPLDEDAKVASATPFSNGARKFSLPVPYSDNRDFMRQFTVEEIDAVVSTFDLPPERRVVSVGHGFCLAMSRHALARIGLLDEERFGRGYWEETEWCLRAVKAGFRHEVVPNLFVWHYHRGSFGGEERSRLDAEHRTIVESMYPDHWERRASIDQANARAWAGLRNRLIAGLLFKSGLRAFSPGSWFFRHPRQTLRAITSRCFGIFLTLLALTTSCSPTPRHPIYIAHAGGEIDGHRYTNSREAVCQALDSGITHIELDLILTSDGHLVAAHDWKKFRQMCGRPASDQPMSLDEFRACSIHGKYTPLTSQDIESIMDAHPEMHLVTDKISSPDILERCLSKHRNRTLVECFSIDDYRTLESMGFTCYYSSRPQSKYTVLKRKIKSALRFRGEYIPDRYAFRHSGDARNAYKDDYGDSFAVFTVSDRAAADRLASLDGRIHYVYINCVK